MFFKTKFHVLLATALGMLVINSCSTVSSKDALEGKFDSLKATTFAPDPAWPPQLPNNWILGDVPGLSIDQNDNIWILQRPGSLNSRELGAADSIPSSECCAPAPSVIQLSPEGKVINAWNIFEPEGDVDPDALWVGKEHGIYIDDEGFVWVSDAKGHSVLKFTQEGKKLLQIGITGETNGSNDTTRLGGPADVAVDILANEIFIADGYKNRRVIVFDTETGAYKRHWGAYGDRPHDEKLPPRKPGDKDIPSFRTVVHAVTLSKAGLIYVADRTNNRIQVFEKDGTFVRETFIANEMGGGSVWDVEFSRDPEQTYVYVPDGMNSKVWVLDHESLEVIGSFGFGGRNSGQFGWVHSLVIDSKGNLYTSEVTPGQRVQKFIPTVSKEES